MIEFSLIDALTKERLKAIEERTTAGSVGAWITPVNAKSLVFDGKKLLVASCELAADATFIANARQDIVWLLEQHRALQKQYAEIRMAVHSVLSDDRMQRPHLDRCKTCKRLVIDSGGHKYKYGCTSLCKEAMCQLIDIGVGVPGLEGLLPYAEDYEPIEQADGEYKADK